MDKKSVLSVFDRLDVRQIIGFDGSISPVIFIRYMNKGQDTSRLE